MYWVGPVIENGFYYDIDLGDEVLSDEDLEKIEREMKKIPYSIILGQKEVDDKTISFRKYGSEETETLSQKEFIKMIKEKIDKKEL